MENDWALVVGIDRYPSAGVKPLKGAVRDAELFFKWVTDPKGGGVERANALLLKSLPPPNATTGGEPVAVQTSAAVPVISQIFDFFDLLPRTGGRRLYVYLSGHGISPTGKESLRNAALLMANAQPPDRWHNFAGNIWAEGTRSCAMFKEVVLIMDCCRDLQDNAVILPFPFGKPTEDGKGCLLLEAYATGWASKARELPLPPDNSYQGVFTHCLLHVLKAGRMTGAVLAEAVREYLTEVLKNQKRPQETEFESNESLVKVIFNEADTTAFGTVTVSGHPAHQPVVKSIPEGGLITQVDLTGWNFGNGIWQGTLEPGKYILVRPGNGEIAFSCYAGLIRELKV